MRSLEICRRHRCPITMRGVGTSQCGESIVPGLQIDTSKYYSRLLEVNAEQQWVRVEPGIVLDELNAQLAPLGLRFAPDISTASRATIGGMMANSAAARAGCGGTEPSTTFAKWQSLWPIRAWRTSAKWRVARRQPGTHLRPPVIARC